MAVTIFTGFIALLAEGRTIQFTFIEFEYVVVFCMMMAVTVVLCGFTGFHYMLLLKNMSTIEHVEKRDPTKKDQVSLLSPGLLVRECGSGLKLDLQHLISELGHSPWSEQGVGLGWVILEP